MISIPQAATLLNRDISLIRRWCQQGRVAGAVKVGRDWLIPTPVKLIGVAHKRPLDTL